jgi:GNAT superfamily N-acetyltransferase
MEERNLTIRPLERADFEAWGVLWKDYLTFYETELPLEIYLSSFERLLSEDQHEFNGLVAVWEGKLVGLTHYLFHRHGWKIENVCYLQDLYVNPDMRGKRIGRALIEAVYAKADEAGSPDVYWNTAEDNHEARRLYDRIGTLTPFVKYKGRK